MCEKCKELEQKLAAAQTRIAELEHELNQSVSREEYDELCVTVSEMLMSAEELKNMAINYVGDFPFHVCFWTEYIKSLKPFGFDMWNIEPDYEDAKKCWQKHGSVHYNYYRDIDPDLSKVQVNW